MTRPPTPTPRPSASVPAGRKAPETPSLKRAVKNKGTENPKSNSRPAADEKGRARPEISAKASPDKSGANRRAVGKKGSKGDKTGKQVALAGATLAATVLDTQVNGEVNPAGSTAVFATILQTARQTGKTLTLGATKTKTAVSGVRKAALGPAPESKVTVQGLASARTAAQSSVLEKTASPVVTVPADPSVLRKALAPVVSAKVRPGVPVTAEAEKDASPVTTAAKSRVIAPKAAATPRPAAQQVQVQNPRAIRPDPDVARGSETLKESWLASMQGRTVVSAGSKTGRSAKPNPGPAARNKVTLQTESGQQAKVTVSAAQGILHKRLGTLSPGADRQVRFVVKEPTGAGRNTVSGDTAPTGIDTTATEALRGGALASGSPVKQIAEAFRSSAARNGQEIVIRLNPPELGRVRVMLRVEGNEVRGVLEVENPRTLSQLQREAPNIMGRLTDAGIEMKRMELSLSENGARDSMRDAAWFSQQYGENGPGHGGWDAPGQGRATDETLSGGPDSEGELQPALMTVGDDSINIWI